MNEAERDHNPPRTRGAGWEGEADATQILSRGKREGFDGFLKGQ